MSKTTLRFTAVAIAAGLSLVGCGSDDAPSDTTIAARGTAPPAIANPASEFCVEQGGTVEIVDEAGGEVGYCNLPDGTRVDEWEYFRSEHPDATEVVATTP